NCHYLRIEAETSKLSHLENYDETSASTYSEFFKKVSFQNLEVIFQSTSEFAAFFPTLIQGRNLDHSNIHLQWWSYGGKEQYLIPEYRKMLLQLPTMNTLTMHWFPDGNLLDDVTLIHLANNTDEASLCSGDCTPYGILKAFETVCKSEHAFKYLSFYAPQSTVDDLSSLSHPNFESINRHSFSLLLIDRQTNSMLVSIREGDHNWVVMSKLDEDGLPAWR
ncbi:hypothetical protein PRIPAC_86154, partial [Pristionchus pacificus]|uniref:Uncharacterized protein n=1 Tax=Pristionchus pacificus TaxID=54126 RepID=A0A2A6BSU8_PRIPA